MRFRRALITFALCAAAASAAPAPAAPLDDIHAAVESNRSADAWSLCATIHRDATPAADLWCGIAAVDTGHVGEGVLALERYTLLNPDDARGRLELARAYFYAGDDRRSREEFEAVRALDPPADVRAGIQRYLDALTSREAQYLPHLAAYVEAGSATTAMPTPACPGRHRAAGAGRVTVADVGVQQGDGFGYLAGSIQYTHPVAPGGALFIGGAGTGNFYFNESEFNLAQVAVNAGGTFRSDANTFALTYQYGEILLDGDNYRSSNGVALEWRRQVDPTTTVSVTPQVARIDYSGANDVRDSDFAALGVGVRHIWLGAWQPVLNASVYGGRERDLRDRPDLGRDVYGANADVTVSPSPFWALNAGFVYLRSNYDGDTPLLDTTRHDDNFVASLGALYLIDRNWSARLEYQYQRNRSNLELYDYSRNLVTVKVRYEFK